MKVRLSLEARRRIALTIFAVGCFLAVFCIPVGFYSFVFWTLPDFSVWLRLWIAISFLVTIYATARAAE